MEGRQERSDFLSHLHREQGYWQYNTRDFSFESLSMKMIDGVAGGQGELVRLLRGAAWQRPEKCRGFRWLAVPTINLVAALVFAQSL